MCLATRSFVNSRDKPSKAIIPARSNRSSQGCMYRAIDLSVGRLVELIRKSSRAGDQEGARLHASQPVKSLHVKAMNLVYFRLASKRNN